MKRFSKAVLILPGGLGLSGVFKNCFLKAPVIVRKGKK